MWKRLGSEFSVVRFFFAQTSEYGSGYNKVLPMQAVIPVGFSGNPSDYETLRRVKLVWRWVDSR